MASFKCGKLLKIPKNSSALFSIFFNFKKHTFYFELINVFPIKHVLKNLYWIVNYVNNLHYNLITNFNDLYYSVISFV